MRRGTATVRLRQEPYSAGATVAKGITVALHLSESSRGARRSEAPAEFSHGDRGFESLPPPANLMRT
jgi:hypothetical protein